MIKSRRTIWARHAVRMGEKRMHREFWLDKTGRKRRLGRTMCSWEGNNVMGVLGTVWQHSLDSYGSGQTVDGLLETW
jgi:hypothetical protein